MSELSKNVRILRTKQGLTQEELGKKIDVSQVTVRNYETEKITPKPTTLVRLARALGVTVEQLVEEDLT